MRGNVVGLPMLDAQTIAALQAEHHAQESAQPGMPSQTLLRCGDLYGASQPMQQLFRLISKVAPFVVNVLITGESGTGKELVAGAIHQLSKVKGKPFIALNCGAISPLLIEAELFGHEKGSFTGAVRMHKGCFERANGGTLFLDELTEMPIEVPTLRERGEDIELLAKLFLAQLNQEEGSRKALSRSSCRFMTEYHWPGNVRELKNMVHRAFILAEDELDLTTAVGPTKQVVAGIESDCVTFPLGGRLADAEQKLIFATLGYCGGNKTQTAEVLGVSLKTLYNRLNEYQSKLLSNDSASQAPPY